MKNVEGLISNPIDQQYTACEGVANVYESLKKKRDNAKQRVDCSKRYTFYTIEFLWRILLAGAFPALLAWGRDFRQDLGGLVPGWVQTSVNVVWTFAVNLVVVWLLPKGEYVLTRGVALCTNKDTQQWLQARYGYYYRHKMWVTNHYRLKDAWQWQNRFAISPQILKDHFVYFLVSLFDSKAFRITSLTVAMTAFHYFVPPQSTDVYFASTYPYDVAACVVTLVVSRLVRRYLLKRAVAPAFAWLTFKVLHCCCCCVKTTTEEATALPDRSVQNATV